VCSRTDVLRDVPGVMTTAMWAEVEEALSMHVFCVSRHRKLAHYAVVRQK
jgi:hypothetical protein